MQKPLAASCIFNGFGKSVGLMQMAELGCLETPLALTNTFSVGAIATAQIRAAVSRASGSRPGVVDGQPAGS